MVKCIECGQPQAYVVFLNTNSKGYGGNVRSERCFNCEGVLHTLDETVKAINMYQPIMGKKRKLTILKYKIEFVK